MIRKVRLRSVCDVNLPTPEFDGLSGETEVSFLPMESVWTDALDLSERRLFDEVSSGYTRFREGDVLLPKITPTFEAGRAAIAEGLEGGIGAGTTELHVLRPHSGLEARFLLYTLSGTEFLQRGHADMYGVAGQKRISEEFVKNYPIPFPPLAQQRQIVDFLDAETNRIDALVNEGHRLLALSSERAHNAQRLLAIEGCRPAAMRRTEVSWLGNVPKHWPIVRLKYEAKLESGHTPSRTQPELWTDCTIPWISLNDVGQLTTHEYISETVNLISEAGLNASSARILPAGTVVVSRDATIGRSSIMAIPMATSQHFADWVCGPNLEPRYLWLLFTTAMQDYFDSLTDGATLRTIGMPDIQALTIPLPPLEEQHEIVAEAEAVRVAAQKLSQELSVQIGLLQERRQALITAAVTEQLDLDWSAA